MSESPSTLPATSGLFVYAPFLNVFGILMTIIMCLTFLVLSGHTLKYLKIFASKIRIIIKKAQDNENED